MKEQREDQETRELFIAEVSIYTDECGEIQFHCLNDCLGEVLGSILNTNNN